MKIFRGHPSPLFFLQTKLTETQEQLQEEDRELIMRLSPLLTKKLQEAEELGEQRGVQRGIELGEQRGIELGEQQGQRQLVENMLRARFGSVDEELSTIVGQMMSLSSEELTQILMQLSTISREELLSRFASDNS